MEPLTSVRPARGKGHGRRQPRQPRSWQLRKFRTGRGGRAADWRPRRGSGWPGGRQRSGSGSRASVLAGASSTASATGASSRQGKEMMPTLRTSIRPARLAGADATSCPLRPRAPRGRRPPAPHRCNQTQRQVGLARPRSGPSSSTPASSGAPNAAPAVPSTTQLAWMAWRSSQARVIERQFDDEARTAHLVDGP